MDEDSDKGTDSEEEIPGAETAGTLGGRKRARYMSRTAMDCASSHAHYIYSVLVGRGWLGHNMGVHACVCVCIYGVGRDFMWF